MQLRSQNVHAVKRLGDVLLHELAPVDRDWQTSERPSGNPPRSLQPDVPTVSKLFS